MSEQQSQETHRDAPKPAPNAEPATVRAIDIERFAQNAARMVEEGGKALAAYLKPREAGKIKDEPPGEAGEMVKTLAHVVEYWMADPNRAAALQHTLGKAYLELWGVAAKRLAGEAVQPVIAPEPRDRRFADPEWSSNPFFDFLKQAYLLSSKWASQLVDDASGLDPHTKHKAEFYVRQLANALSPSNFVLTNPELLRETLASNAENLVRGMQMLAEDIEAGHGDLKIRQSDASKFQVGGNLAPTPGKVIYQNELMQLIQYAPDDRDGDEAAAADRAAVDQQVLHSRPDAGEVFHQMVRRPGADGVRDLLGQSRCPSSPRRASRTTCARGR